MKKFILLLVFFVTKSLTSQNGWTTYTATLPSGNQSINSSALIVDNLGQIWEGYNNSLSSSSAAFGVYNGSGWNFYNKTNTPILPSNKVTSLAKDNSNNIWIGTPQGLVKFDGTNFTVYTTTQGLPSNNILCLESINNMLYIGTDSGLSRFDGFNFTNYTIGNSLFPINTVTCIKVENPNLIWFGTIDNIVRFSINSSFTSSSYTLSTTTFTCGAINCIYLDLSGNKWLGTTQAPFIIKYDNSNFTSAQSIYGNLYGAQWPNGCYSILKGPNNGILFPSRYNYSPSANNCLVELIPSGSYNVFYVPVVPFPQDQYLRLGNYLTYDASSKLLISKPQPINSIFNHMMCSLNFTVYNGFGLGPGITSNNYKYLDVNRVKAGIMNRGDMWWDIGGSGNASYEVPKGSGVHSGFGGSLWMGGLDASNQLHIAGQTYRQTGNDYWPGPLDTTNASIDSATAMNYDKIWKIDYNDINTFITQFNLGNVPLTYTPTADIMNWPAKGTGNKAKNLAPFVDVNNNGIYDPLVGGDYPKIKGDQTLYFIFNDNFTTHSETKGLPLGIEVHAMAYAYGCPTILNGRNELAYTTFYDYKIHNRSSNNYHDVYVGLWADIDLGDYLDDYIGSSVNENLGFCYNADSIDYNGAGAGGYNHYPPAIGTTVLKGPLASVSDGKDNDNDNLLDEPGEQCLMNYFDYYNNNVGNFPTQTTNPWSKYHFYNILQGMWKDSTDHTCGGNAYGGTTKAIFDYPWSNYIGNPCGTWTEITAGNIAGDRRYIVSSGPFLFPANSMTEVEYAQVWSVDSSATIGRNIASVNKLITDAQKIRAFYGGTKTNCLSSINIGVEENVLNDQLLIYPNPANSVLNIKSENSLGKSVILITDVLGKTIIETKNNDLYQTSINIEQLSSGVYLLQLKSEKGIIVKKFVKE
jgi:hypothetical protein